MYCINSYVYIIHFYSNILKNRSSFVCTKIGCIYFILMYPILYSVDKNQIEKSVD